MLLIGTWVAVYGDVRLISHHWPVDYAYLL